MTDKAQLGETKTVQLVTTQSGSSDEAQDLVAPVAPPKQMIFIAWPIYSSHVQTSV